MKRKRVHLVGTTKKASRRWSHADPEDMRKLLDGDLEPKSATALRRHLRDCLDCALLAGRLAAIQGTDLEVTS
jgi:anti-sigma factor RsiW